MNETVSGLRREEETGETDEALKQLLRDEPKILAMLGRRSINEERYGSVFLKEAVDYVRGSVEEGLRGGKIKAKDFIHEGKYRAVIYTRKIIDFLRTPTGRIVMEGKLVRPAYDGGESGTVDMEALSYYFDLEKIIGQIKDEKIKHDLLSILDGIIKGKTREEIGREMGGYTGSNIKFVYERILRRTGLSGVLPPLKVLLENRRRSQNRQEKNLKKEQESGRLKEVMTVVRNYYKELKQKSGLSAEEREEMDVLEYFLALRTYDDTLGRSGRKISRVKKRLEEKIGRQLPPPRDLRRYLAGNSGEDVAATPETEG